jgi:hypothetical protein
LVWNFSNQTGKSIGTPGALLGWSCRDMAAPFFVVCRHCTGPI